MFVCAYICILLYRSLSDIRNLLGQRKKKETEYSLHTNLPRTINDSLILSTINKEPLTLNSNINIFETEVIKMQM